MKKIAFVICLLCISLFSGLRAFCSPVDTVRLFYGINTYELQDLAQLKIKHLVDSLDKGKPIVIKGFADYLGDKAHNRVLSQKRANEVKAYLFLLKGSLSVVANGEGQILSADEKSRNGEPVNRRVEIIFDKIPATNKNTASVKPVNDSVAALLISFSHKVDSLSLQEIGKGISLDELTFNPGYHSLERESMPFLDILTKYLIANKDLNFEIRGHICCTDQRRDGYDRDAGTYNLSVNRAKEIYKHFIKKGIDEHRMTYTGVGSTQPKVYPELTDRDQQLNRRVEIIILNKR